MRACRGRVRVLFLLTALWGLAAAGDGGCGCRGAGGREFGTGSARRSGADLVSGPDASRAGRPGFCRGGASTEIPGAGRRSRSGRAQARGGGFFSHRRAPHAGAPAQRNAGLGAHGRAVSRGERRARRPGTESGCPAAFIGRFGRQRTRISSTPGASWTAASPGGARTRRRFKRCGT